MEYVFVYGTLKRKYGNHGVLGKSKFIGEAVTNSKGFVMFDGGFPFVSDNFNSGGISDFNGSILGELYCVTDTNVNLNLDRLEGVPHLYVRKDITVTTLDGEKFDAVMYVASEGSNERLKTRTPMEPKGRSRLLEWRG